MLLPKPHKVKNDDIYYRSGARDYLKQIEKKKAAEPHVFRIEGELSQFSLYDAQSIQELDERQQIHEEYADDLRRFYYSKQQAKEEEHTKSKKKNVETRYAMQRESSLMMYLHSRLLFKNVY